MENKKEYNSLEQILEFLKNNKQYLHKRFGVTKLGIFGSFVTGENTPKSDLDVVVEIKKEQKDIHNFLSLKRYLEKKLKIKIDIGFLHTLKPYIKEKIKDKIKYV